jgi:Icc-related predicted phosphoesterase
LLFIASCGQDITVNEVLNALRSNGIDEKVDAMFIAGGAPINRVNELKSLVVKIYSITSRYDDHYIADMLRESTIFVESKVLYLGNNLYLAGIGGREPLANIRAVTKSTEQLPSNKELIVLSYYPPRKICDKTILGGRKGLQELSLFIQRIKPLITISCESGPGVLRYNNKEVVCLGTPQDKCIALIEVGEKKNKVLLTCLG